MLTPLKISVIVPIYNHWNLVAGLLESLKQQSLEKEKFEIIFVDNGSADVPNPELLPSDVRLLHCIKPGSYAARNVGIRHARGELLAFTDADCRPAPDWLANALARHTENRMTLIAGAVQMVPLDWGDMTMAEVHEVALGIPQAKYSKKGYAATANLFIPRGLFDKYDLFDEKRFSGGDAEFCRRVTVDDNTALRYCEEILVEHPARTELGELIIKKRRIKGGQITAGTQKQRFIWIFRTLCPPVDRWWKIFLSPKLSTSQQFLACWLEVKLWLVGVGEMLRLLMGCKPIR